MASLLKIKHHYYSQFYDTDRDPVRKRIPLKTKTPKVAERLHRSLEEAFPFYEHIYTSFISLIIKLNIT